MVKKVKRVWKVMTKEGIKTFTYLVKTNLRAKQSPKRKYQYWRKVHEGRQEFLTPAAEQPFFSVITLKNHDNKGDTLRECLQKTKGQYVGFLQEGDLLSANTFQCLEQVLKSSWGQDKLLFYSDEDRINEKNERSHPFFKPDYSPDTLRSFFYMGGFLVMKRTLLEKLTFCMDRPISYGGYLLALEASFHITDQDVCHIPQVLYHRKNDDVVDCVENMAADKKELLRNYGIDVETELVADCRESRVRYVLKEQPSVSIIIPSKDNPSMLGICLDSIRKYTDYENYEIVIVDNGSSTENRMAYEALCRQQPVHCRYYYEKMEFNFSKMCNMGAGYATGDYYLFLNDDIEIRKSEGDVDWLTRLMGQAVQPHTGVTGAKLLYPGTNKIQHIGVVNYESGAAHILSKAEDDKPMLFGRNRMDYNYSIVTGACFLVNADKYHQVGGFCEDLAVTFNDVELCFRFMKAGYYNVLRNDVVLYHHESITRGEDAVNPKKFLRHLKEREKLFIMHPEFVKRDRFYSENLTQTELDGAVNIQYRPQSFAVSSQPVETRPAKEGDGLVWMVESVTVQEQICIRGFAYVEKSQYNNYGKTEVVLRGEQEQLCVQTMRLYNPTIAPQMESKVDLNFAEFYTVFPREALGEKKYVIGLRVKLPGRKQAVSVMTEQLLELD